MDPVVVLGGASGIAAAVASWGMAVFVYGAAPSRAQNRLVAIFLVLVGFQMGAAFGINRLLPLTSDAGYEAVSMTAALWQSLVYLALLGTLDTPLSRAFRSAPARVACLAAGALFVVAYPLYHRTIVDAAGRELFAYYPLLGLHGLVLLYGFFVAVSAWRRAAPGSASRARGRAFTFAFGVRDVVFFAFISVAVVAETFLQLSDTTPVGLFWLTAQDILVPLSVVAMVLLMGYGMAKAHLFEVDLKLKAGVRRGSIAAAFLLVFLVVSQLVEAFSSQTFGLVGGALASGLLLFAIAPLQRAAERISGTVVPDARPLSERTREERAELYREQVRIAWEDGKLGLKERRMLDAARERLGLGADVAVALEGEVTRTLVA